MKNILTINQKTILIKTLIIGVVITLLFFIITFIISILPPGKIDLFLKEKQYTYITNTLFTPDYYDIHWIQDNVIYFNNRNACWLQSSPYHYICSEPLYSFLQQVKWTKIYDITINYDKKIIKIRNIWSGMYTLDSTYEYYMYKQSWFSQEEKTARNILQILNNNWLVAEGNISAIWWKWN